MKVLNTNKHLFIFLATFIAMFVFSTLALAQDYKIVGLEGKVFVREGKDASWQEAKKDDVLSNNYELETKENAECTLSSGEKADRNVMLKQNSHLIISDATAGHLELGKGRVFALVDKMEKNADFKIKTPTVIAGVRGTGWSVEADQENSVKCFEGEVSVEGLDNEGNVVSDGAVIEGTGVAVSKSGEVDEPRELAEKDKKEWLSFRNLLKDLVGKPLGEAMKVVGSVSKGGADAMHGGETSEENPFNR